MKRNDFKIDFIGIGAPRCGTTWIYECLKEHPQICASEPKELVFFNKKKQYLRGIDYYCSHFRHCDENKIKGEISPQYMPSKGTAQRIKSYFPEVKLLTVLRNPIERAFSHYYYLRSGGSEKIPTFEAALKNQNRKLYLVDYGLYYTQLKKYLEVFPKENILILIYEDILGNSVKFIQNIYKFLGANENFIPQSVDKRINPPTTAHKAIEALKRPALMERIKQIPKAGLLIDFFKKRLKSPYLKPPMKEETRIYLQQIYKEEIGNLEKLLNRKLDFWK